MAAIGDVVVKVRMDTAEFDRQLHRMQRRIDRAQSRLTARVLAAYSTLTTVAVIVLLATGHY